MKNDDNTRFCTASYFIRSYECSVDNLRLLLKDGEIESGTAWNNQKYYDRSASQLLEDAGLDDHEYIGVLHLCDDSNYGLQLSVQYPLHLFAEVKARAEQLSDLLDEFDICEDEPEAETLIEDGADAT